MKSANKIACYCIRKSKEFSQIENGILISNLVLDKQGKPRSSNNLSLLKSICNLGVYAFLNEQGDYLYIGQGGGGNSTPLRSRIGQELRLYKNTKNGNNGGTFSKNIQSEEQVHFENADSFKKYIANWRLRILHAKSFDVSLDLLESFLIQLHNPKYNKRGIVQPGGTTGP